MKNWSGRLWNWSSPRKRKGRRGQPLQVDTPGTPGPPESNPAASIAIPPLMPARLKEMSDDLRDQLTAVSLALGAAVLDSHRLAAELSSWNGQAVVQRRSGHRGIALAPDDRPA